jgi:hypothetical protein
VESYGRPDLETRVVHYSCLRLTVRLTLLAKDFRALRKHAEMFDPPNYLAYDRWLTVFSEASARLDALETAVTDIRELLRDNENVDTELILQALAKTASSHVGIDQRRGHAAS